MKQGSLAGRGSANARQVNVAGHGTQGSAPTKMFRRYRRIGPLRVGFRFRHGAVQYAAYLLRQGGQRVRLLDEVCAWLQHAMAHYRLVRIAGRVDDLGVGMRECLLV